jgi:large subunit ribosomal protein L25
VHFIHEDASPGIKRGGVLNIVHHELPLLCPVENIPEAIEIDLTGLDIGTTIHINDVKLPAGVVIATAEQDFTVATIAPPTVRGEEEETAAEGEGEGA